MLTATAVWGVCTAESYLTQLLRFVAYFFTNKVFISCVLESNLMNSDGI